MAVDPASVAGAAGEPGVRDLHVRDHRAAQGRDDPSRGIVNNLLDLNESLGVGPEDRVLALSSSSFDMSVYETFGILAAGGAIVFPEGNVRRDPVHWAELIRTHRVTVWNSAPALLEMLVCHAQGDAGRTLPELRQAILGGDWVAVSLPDRLRRVARGAAGGPRRRHRSLDPFDRLAGRRRRPLLDQHPLRPADGQPAGLRARRGPESRAGQCARRAVPGRARAGGGCSASRAGPPSGSCRTPSPSSSAPGSTAPVTWPATARTGPSCSSARRSPGQDSRVSHRAGRDRGSPSRAPSGQGGRRCRPRGPPRREGTRRLPRAPANGHAGRFRRVGARRPPRLHGPVAVRRARPPAPVPER